MNGGRDSRHHDHYDLLADYTQTPSPSLYNQELDLDSEAQITSYLPDLDSEFTSAFSIQTTTRRHTLDPVLDLKSELARLRLANQIGEHELQSLSKAIRSGFSKFDSFFAVPLEDREEDDQRIASELVANTLTNIAAQSNTLRFRASGLLRLLVCRNDRFYAIQNQRRKCVAFYVWKTRFGSQRALTTCSNAIARYQPKTDKSLHFYRWYIQKQEAKFRRDLNHIAIFLYQFQRRHLSKMFFLKWRLSSGNSLRQSELRRKAALVSSWIRWIRIYANRWRQRCDQLRIAHGELIVEHRAQQRFQSLSSCFHAWRSFSSDKKHFRSLQQLKKRRLKALVFWRWMGAIDRFSSTRLNHCIDCGSVLRTVSFCNSPQMCSAEIQTEEVRLLCDVVESTPTTDSVEVQTDNVRSPTRHFTDFYLSTFSVDPVEKASHSTQVDANPVRDVDIQTLGVEITDSQSQTQINNDESGATEKIRRLERTIVMLRDQLDRERTTSSAAVDPGILNIQEAEWSALQAKISKANERCSALERQNTELFTAASHKDNEIAELHRRLSESVDKCSVLERTSSSTLRAPEALSAQGHFTDLHPGPSVDPKANAGAAASSSIISESVAIAAKEEECLELRRQLSEAVERCSKLQQQHDATVFPASSDSALAAKEGECSDLRRQLSEAHERCAKLQRRPQTSVSASDFRDDILKDPVSLLQPSSKDQEIAELRKQLSQAVVMCSKLRQIVFSLSKKSESPSSKPKKRSRTDPNIHFTDMVAAVSVPELGGTSDSEVISGSCIAASSSRAQDGQTALPQKAAPEVQSAVAKSACDPGKPDRHFAPLNRTIISKQSDESFQRILALCRKLATGLQIELPAMELLSDVTSHAAICESLEKAVALFGDNRKFSQRFLSASNWFTTEVSSQTDDVVCSRSRDLSLIDTSSTALLPLQTDLRQMRLLTSEYPDLFGSCGSLTDFFARLRELFRSSLEVNREDAAKYHNLVQYLRSLQSEHSSMLGSFANITDICDNIQEALVDFRQLQQDVIVWEDCLRNRFAFDISISPAVPSEVVQTIECIKNTLVPAVPESCSISIGTDDSDLDSVLQLTSIFKETSDWHRIESHFESLSASPNFHSFFNTTRQLIESNADIAVRAFQSRISTLTRMRYFQRWLRLHRLHSKAKQFLSRCSDTNLRRAAAKRFLRSWVATSRNDRADELAASKKYLLRFFSAWARFSALVRVANQLKIRLQIVLLKSSFSQWRSLCFVRVRQRLFAQPSSRVASTSSFDVIRRSTIFSESQALTNPTLTEVPVALASSPELSPPHMDRSLSLDSQVDQDFHLFVMVHERQKKRALRAKYWYRWRFAACASEAAKNRTGTDSIVGFHNRLSEMAQFVIRRFDMRELKLAKAFLHWRCLFLQSQLCQKDSVLVNQPGAPAPLSPSCDTFFTNRIVEFVSNRSEKFRIRSLLIRTFLQWRSVLLVRRLHHTSQRQPVSIHCNSSLKAATFYMWRNRCLTSWLFEAQQLDVARSAMHQRHVTLIVWRMTSRWRQSQLLAISHFRRNMDLKIMRRIFSTWTTASLEFSRRRHCLSRSLRLVRLLHIRKAWRNWSCLPKWQNTLSQELLLNSLLQKVRQLRRQIELQAITSEVRAVDPVKTFCQSVLS